MSLQIHGAPFEASDTSPRRRHKMSLRAKSHSDLQSVGKSLDDPLLSSLSLSSSSMNKPRSSPGAGPGSNGPNGRRPVRAVRPISAVAPTGSFLQINHLQGELVRKRKECEDLKRENKYLSNEIHMERIMMRNENELTMKNLRNLNHDLQNQLKELKHKLQQSQQRAALSSRAVEEAESSRGDAEKSRAAAEARALGSDRERQVSDAERRQLSDQLLMLKREHKDLQQLQAQTEKSFFETKLKLDRVLGEKQVLMEEKLSLEQEREALRQRLRQSSQENSQLQQSEQNLRRRAVMSEEESQKANQAQREADAERRLVEKDRQERVSECLQWKERFQDLNLKIRAEEELRALRQNKACQANIQSFFLCMTENDQKVKILRNPDGTPRNFTEGDPVFISTESSPEDPERSPSRSMVRVVAPGSSGPAHFDELPPFSGDKPDSASASRRQAKKVVEYFWIPTNQE